MELAQAYLWACRKHPDKMEWVIEQTSKDINRVVETYSRGVQITFGLKRDLNEMINNYLINKGIHDLFEVRLYDHKEEYRAPVLKAEIKFIYAKGEKEIEKSVGSVLHGTR